MANRELTVTIVGDAADALRAFEQVGSGAQRMAQKVGRQMVGAGAAVTGITAPIIGAGAAAVKTSIDFESAFAGVRKTVEATEEEFAVIRRGIIEMSKDLPASAGEIAAVAEAAGQLGVRQGDILGFTRTMIDLGETTNLQAGDAATQLARFANITQLPIDQADRLGSTVVALGNNLATTESEVVNFGLRIAGAGAQVGLSEAQILAFGGALSSVGIDAEAGGTAISRVFVEISKEVSAGGDRLADFARIAGVSVPEFAALFERDAAQAVLMFIEGLGRLDAQGENVFSTLESVEFQNVRVRDALLRASGAGDLLRDSLGLADEAWQENVALTEEANQRYGTTAAKLETLRNRVAAVAIQVGDVLLPAVQRFLDDAVIPLIGKLEGLAAWFTSLNPKVQLFIGVVVALTAAVGALSVAVGLFLLAVAPIGLTVGGIILGLVLLGAAIAAVIIWWDDITAAIGRFLGFLRDTAERAIAGFVEFVDSKFGLLLLLLGPAGVLILTAIRFRDQWAAIFNVLKQVIATVFEGIKRIVGGAVAWITDKIEDARRLLQTLQNIASTVGDVAGDIGGGIKGAASGAAGLLGFQSGGVVPGPIGAPRLAVVHGGEEVLTPAQRHGGDVMHFQFNVGGNTLADIVVEGTLLAIEQGRL